MSRTTPAGGTLERSRPVATTSLPLEANPRAVLGPVKVWPGNTGATRQARRPTLTVPARGAPLHPQVGTKERPPGTNKGTVQSQEAIDDVINTLIRADSPLCCAFCVFRGIVSMDFTASFNDCGK